MRKGQKIIRFSLESFWARVNKTESCWLWISTLWPSGYGRVRVHQKDSKAHRVAWILTHGAIPEEKTYPGMCVLHKCDVRACVNPEHLFLGTSADNMADKTAKGRQSKGPEHRKKVFESAPKGSQHPLALLTEEQVREIRVFTPRVRGYRKLLAERYGVSVHTISHVVSERGWRHLK